MTVPPLSVLSSTTQSKCDIPELPRRRCWCYHQQLEANEKYRPLDAVVGVFANNPKQKHAAKTIAIILHVPAEHFAGRKY